MGKNPLGQLSIPNRQEIGSAIRADQTMRLSTGGQVCAYVCMHLGMHVAVCLCLCVSPRMGWGCLSAYACEFAHICIYQGVLHF